MSAKVNTLLQISAVLLILSSIGVLVIANKLPDFYKSAISELSRTTPLDELSTLLLQIFENNGSDSFSTMVEAQLYLFNDLGAISKQDDKYNFNMGYYFQNIQENSHFQRSLTQDQRTRLIRSRSLLPGSVQHFFSQPTFCLLNKAYSEFLYTTARIDADNQRRYDFTWRTQNHVLANGAWLRNLTDLTRPGDLKLNLLVSLKSNSEKIFLYLERNSQQFMNMILGWNNGNAPPNSSWKVELFNNQLVFTQNNYILCASDKVRDANRRYVYGLADEVHTVLSPVCQWIAKSCP